MSVVELVVELLWDLALGFTALAIAWWSLRKAIPWVHTFWHRSRVAVRTAMSPAIRVTELENGRHRGQFVGAVAATGSDTDTVTLGQVADTT
jgi:hypothetical protein